MKLLKFSASWCQPCKQLSKVLENTELPDNVSLEEIDIDANIELAAKYRVRSVPTMILLDSDNIVATKIGAMTKEAFTAWIKPLTS